MTVPTETNIRDCINKFTNSKMEDLDTKLRKSFINVARTGNLNTIASWKKIDKSFATSLEARFAKYLGYFNAPKYIWILPIAVFAFFVNRDR